MSKFMKFFKIFGVVLVPKFIYPKLFSIAKNNSRNTGRIQVEFRSNSGRFFHHLGHRNSFEKTYEPAYNRKGSKGLGSIWD